MLQGSRSVGRVRGCHSARVGNQQQHLLLRRRRQTLENDRRVWSAANSKSQLIETTSIPVRLFVSIRITFLLDLGKQTFDVVIEACGVVDVLREGFTSLRPGGAYILVGLVHPNSALPFTAEDLIRKCATLIGDY